MRSSRSRLLVSSLVRFALHLVLLRHPALWDPDNPPRPSGTAGLLTFVSLLTLALVIAMIWPGVGYASLVVLFLSGPVQRWLPWPR